MTRVLGPLLLGFVGCLILTSLGVWQLQRLAWKEGILAEMDDLLSGEPVELIDRSKLDLPRFTPVSVEGRTTGDEVHVLTSVPGVGPGYRLISAFETGEGLRILLDEGFIPAAAKTEDRGAAELAVIGNLHLPEEVDGFTPEPDREANIWYARDVPAIAEVLEAEAAAMVIVRSIESGSPRAAPLPLDTSGIPNNHLGYAVQWFGLAIVWAGMTLFLLWRIRKRSV